MFSYPLLPADEAVHPGVCRAGRISGGRTAFSARRGESDRVAKPIRGEFISGNYFSTFGVGAFAGRTIVPADDQPTSAPVAMLSYRAWQQQYGVRSEDRRLDHDPRRPSVDHRGHHAARIFRRDAAQRSSGDMDPAPAGADLQRDRILFCTPFLRGCA